MEYPSTPVPNWFFQLAPDLSEAELRIMVAIYGQTIRFSNPDGTRQKVNVLSYTFLAKETGMTGTSAISKALKSLRARGCIAIKGKRITGQQIEVTPSSPILPVEVLLLEESRLLLEESQTPLKGVADSSKRSHIKKPPKKLFKETPPWVNFTPDQEESLQILVGVGIDQDISRQLIVKAWERGRDSEYISQVVGYVNSVKAKNPPGMVRSLIEQNSGRIPTSNGQQSPAGPINLDKYAHGGKDHKLVESTCPICHPELQEVENAQV